MTLEPSADKISPVTRYQAADRLRLAQAVLREGERVRYLNPDNTAGDWVALEQAIDSGRPFFGTLDEEMLGFDADSARACQGLRLLQQRLKECGIAFVLLDSGGGAGRKHLFARVSEPALRASLEEQARAHGLDVRRFMRPPLTPHRLTGASRLRTPTTVDEAEAALQHRPYRALPSNIQYMIDTEISDHPSSSERLMSAACSMYQGGWTPQQGYRELYDKPGGQSLRRVEDGGRSPWLFWIKTWEKARVWVQANPALQDRHDAVAALCALRDRVQQQRWVGAAGTTQRLVLTALLDIAITVGSVTVSASHRQLVEATGRATRKAISSALEVLRQQGWLDLVQTGTGTHASTYRLTAPGATKTPPATSLSWGGVRASGAFVTHDVFARGGGLGLSAALLYEALDLHPRPVADLAARAGRTAPTTRRALRSLELRGLALRGDDGWVRGPMELDDIAARRGSAGSGAELAARHQLEREDYRGHRPTSDGRMEYVVQRAAEHRVCTSTTRSGQACRAFAVLDQGLCAAHLRQEQHRRDEQYAAELEAELAWQYEATVYVG